MLRTLIISQDCRRHPTHTLRQCRSTGGAKRAWNRGGPARDCRDGRRQRKRLHHQVLGPSVRFTRLSLSHPPDAPSTAPHLGLQYYLQSADCLLSNPTPSAHHPRPRLPFVRPLFVKRITLPLSFTITPRHALCTPFHRPAFTALVRINLVTSTGPQRQQQERHTPTHRHTEREQSISYEIFHLATSNIKHQTSSKNLCDRSVRYSGHTLIFYSRDIWSTSTPATSAAHLEYPLVRSRSP